MPPTEDTFWKTYCTRHHLNHKGEKTAVIPCLVLIKKIPSLLKCCTWHIINAKILQHSKTRDTSLVHITDALFTKVLTCDFTSAILLGTLCCVIPSLPLYVHLKQFLPPGHSTSLVHFCSPMLSGRIPMLVPLLCKCILRIRTFTSPAECVASC